MFDRDGNGTIDASELREIMYILGQATTEEELQAMISNLDQDSESMCCSC